MFLFVCAAMLVSRGFGHVVELFLFVFILATALAALAAEDSVSVAIFQNGCDDDDAIFDTVTCPKAYGCRVPIKNDTDLVGVGADEYEDDRGTATPTVYNRSNKLTAGFECEVCPCPARRSPCCAMRCCLPSSKWIRGGRGGGGIRNRQNLEWRSLAQQKCTEFAAVF